MLEFAGINYWAVAVVWLLYVIVGAFWYSPAGFSKQWKKHTGVDLMKLPQSEATNAIVSVALSAVVQVLTLALVINSLGATTAMDGLATGAVLWLGFTAATTVGVTLYQRRSWNFLWLNSSYFLLVMTVGAALLAVWQ